MKIYLHLFKLHLIQLKKDSLLRLIGSNKNLKESTYSIINLLGQTIKKGNVNESRVINVDQFKSGVYILRINNEFTTTSKRFIVE